MSVDSIPISLCNEATAHEIMAGNVPALSRAQIEQIERTHFAHLYEVEAEVTPKPPVLQALWANCTDY